MVVQLSIQPEYITIPKSGTNQGKQIGKQANDWKPLGTPDIKKCVIVKTPVDLPQETTGSHGLARSVIVKLGGKLTIDPKSSLTIQNYLKMKPAASDVL